MGSLKVFHLVLILATALLALGCGFVGLWTYLSYRQEHALEAASLGFASSVGLLIYAAHVYRLFRTL